jgi:hypothetical protein
MKVNLIFLNVNFVDDRRDKILKTLPAASQAERERIKAEKIQQISRYESYLAILNYIFDPIVV